MKRFVKEFADYEIKSLKDNPRIERDFVEEKVDKINKIVCACEQCMISPAEACRCIAEQTM